jgi:hypothetical protein
MDGQNTPAGRDPDAAPNELADLLGPFWSADRARKALAATETELADLRRDGRLLGVASADGHGRVFYPIAQFENHGGRTRVRPALQRFFAALRAHDAWTVGVLMHTPAPELGDLTPLQWAREGRDLAPVVSYAERLAAELRR